MCHHMNSTSTCEVIGQLRWSKADAQFSLMFPTETPPPGYISEDGEASDQQMNQSMDTGTRG